MTSRRPSTSGTPLRLEHDQRVLDLAAEAERLLVDQEQVGAERLGGVADDRGADAERLLDVDVQVERGVFAVAQLDDAGHAHEIDARLEIEAADDRRARQDQDRQVLVALDQRMRHRPAAAQMAEAQRVMAVNENAGATALNGPSSLAQGCGPPLAPRPRTMAQRAAGEKAMFLLTGKTGWAVNLIDFTYRCNPFMKHGFS